MEYATFAHTLQHVRTARLNEMLAARRALVMGDGDGRFLRALLAANPRVQVDAVDASAAMLALARKRAASLDHSASNFTADNSSSDNPRVTWHHADMRGWLPTLAVHVPRGTSNSYDLVVTHYFLDCFSSGEVSSIVAKTAAAMAPGAAWIHSDFAVPARGLMRWPSLAIVRGLYLGFGLLTGLETTRLPDDSAAFTAAGLHCESQRLFLGGLMKSELWRMPELQNATKS